MSHIPQCVNGFIVTSSSVQWTIRVYDSNSQKEKREFTSPPFRFLEADWTVEMTVHGSGYIHTPGRMSLSLQKVCHKTGRDSFQAEISIKTPGGIVIGSWTRKCEIFVDEDDLAWSKPVEGPEFECVNKYAERFKVLTVFCSLNTRNEMVESATQIPEEDAFEKESGKKTSQHAAGKYSNERDGKGRDPPTGLVGLLGGLSLNFSQLLLSEKFSDVRIKIEGEEFPAHRAMLAARSPVFKAMLERDTAEKRSGVIEISDCSPLVFKEFLKYLYSGKSEGVSQENVCGVYQLADKYGVEHLKAQCVTIMTRGLDEASFYDTILLAAKHDESELIDIATDFFVSNAKGIVPTVRWQTFMSENVTMANELFLKTLNKLG